MWLVQLFGIKVISTEILSFDSPSGLGSLCVCVKKKVFYFLTNLDKVWNPVYNENYLLGIVSQLEQMWIMQQLNCFVC